MKAGDGMLREDPGRRSSALMCGKPGCATIARHTADFHWVDGDWSGVLGACDEHLEDLGVVVLKRRAVDA